MNYEIECKLCPEGRRPVYIGETARNLYTRAKEHMAGENREGVRKGQHSLENIWKSTILVYKAGLLLRL